MNSVKAMTKKCTYCMCESEVVGISVRTIPGYKNAITGKDTAMVEKLSCGHEFIDGKFNTDNLYYTAPAPVENLTRKVEELNKTIAQPIRFEYHYPARRSGGVNTMDIAVVICLPVLALMCPPLVILPILYFIGRAI